MRRSVVGMGLAVVIGVSGCSSEDGSGPSNPPAPVVRTCGVPSIAKPLVMHAAFAALVDAGYVSAHASATDRAYALSLIGSSKAVIGHASGVERCSEPRSSAPYCLGAGHGDAPPAEEPTSGSNGGCFRLGCETVDVATIDVYMHEGAPRGVEVRERFTYATEAPVAQGTMDCAENPLRTYRIDVRDPAAPRVDASLTGSCSFTAPSGERVDLSHQGAITARQGTTTVTLTFAKLGSEPLVITLAHAHAHGDGPPEGEATIGGRVVMRTQAPSVTQPPFKWEGDCADSI